MKKAILISALIICVTTLWGQDESRFAGDYIINEKCTSYERGDTLYNEYIKKIRIFKDSSDNYIFSGSRVSNNVIINKFRADSFYIDKQSFLQTDYYYDNSNYDSVFFSINGSGIVKQDSIHYYYKVNDFFGGFCVGAGTRIMAHPDTAYHLRHFLPDSAQFIDNCDKPMYNIAGDTIINGKKMKKVYRNTESYYAAIYEDTMNAKYYAVCKGDTAEKLIVDFSVNKGDRLTVYNMNYKIMNYNLMAYDVSFDENGRKIIRISCNGRGECDVWVEGVGSVWSGVFPDIDCDRKILAPKCPLSKVVVGKDVVYGQNEPISKVVVSINGTKANADIRIYPNPAKDYLLIDTEDFECLTYVIVSTDGAILQSGELPSCIDITNLPNGINLIIVRNDNGEIVYSNRFIKN